MGISSLLSRHTKTFQTVVLAGAIALGTVGTMAGQANADPGAITNLHVTSTHDVIWDPVPGAYYYEVAEYASNGGQYHMVLAPQNTFHDTYLDGYAHEFEVWAVFSPPGAQSIAGPDAWASDAPMHVQFKGNSLTWSPAIGPVGYPTVYNIYRNGTLVTSTGGTNLSGTLYYHPTSISSGDTFTVAVADPDGSGTSVSLTGAAVYLATPSGIKLYNECNRGYELDWSPVPGAASYNVYGDGVLLASGITDTRYGFGGASAQSYQVTAVNGSAESAPSAAWMAQVSNAAMDWGACG